MIAPAVAFVRLRRSRNRVPCRGSLRPLPQAKYKEAVTRGNRDILFAVDSVAHGPRRHIGAKARLPEQRTTPGVERVEITLTSAGEEHVSSGRQDAAGRYVVHFERPLLRPCRGIDSRHDAVCVLFMPGVDADEL